MFESRLEPEQVRQGGIISRAACPSSACLQRSETLARDASPSICKNVDLPGDPQNLPQCLDRIREIGVDVIYQQAVNEPMKRIGESSATTNGEASAITTTTLPSGTKETVRCCGRQT